MNKFIDFVKKTFTRKNSILFFLMSFVISIVTVVSLATSTILSEIKYSDYAAFADNFSYLPQVKDYDSIMAQDFSGLNYNVLIKCGGKIKTNINLGDRKFVLVGVDENFTYFPMPNFMNNVFESTLEKQDIVGGESFTKEDILCRNKVIIMNNYYLSEVGFSGENIFIDDVSYTVKGVLSDYSTMYKYNDEIRIPIYMPYTTLQALYKENRLSYDVVIETQGYRFEKYEDAEGDYLVSKYIKNIEKQNYCDELISNSAPIIISLFAVSFLAIFIIQFIIVKNKHNEIGIKRAIGASKSDIIFEFLSEFSIITFLAVVIGAIFGVLLISMHYIRQCFLCNAPILNLNISLIIISLLSYFGFVFLASLTSVFIGTNINIAGIIVEER